MLAAQVTAVAVRKYDRDHRPEEGTRVSTRPRSTSGSGLEREPVRTGRASWLTNHPVRAGKEYNAEVPEVLPVLPSATSVIFPFSDRALLY